MSAILGQMAIKILKPIVQEAGASVLQDLLRKLPGGDVIGGLLEQITGKLGIEPTPAALEEAWNTNPAEVIHATQLVEEFYARIEEARAASMQSQHRLQETELTKGGFLARIGRPLNTIAFAFECIYLVVAAAGMLRWGAPAGTDLNTLVPLLVAVVVPVLTIQAGIIGYDARQQRLAAREH